MEYKHNKRLVPQARELRKNMTKEEKHLWYDFLRHYPVRFLRQKVLGRFIADFYCAKAKLVIEVDGCQHYQEDYRIRDAERTELLEAYGLIVLRIPNQQVNENFAQVCSMIDEKVRCRLEELQK